MERKKQNSVVFFNRVYAQPTIQEYEKETTETVRGLFEEVDELFYREEHVANPKSSVQASFLNTRLFFQAASIEMQDLKTVIPRKSGNKEEYRDRTEKVLTRLSPGQMM